MRLRLFHFAAKHLAFRVVVAEEVVQEGQRILRRNRRVASWAVHSLGEDVGFPNS